MPRQTGPSPPLKTSWKCRGQPSGEPSPSVPLSVPAEAVGKEWRTETRPRGLAYVGRGDRLQPHNGRYFVLLHSSRDNTGVPHSGFCHTPGQGHSAGIMMARYMGVACTPPCPGRGRRGIDLLSRKAQLSSQRPPAWGRLAREPAGAPGTRATQEYTAGGGRRDVSLEVSPEALKEASDCEFSQEAQMPLLRGPSQGILLADFE